MRAARVAAALWIALLASSTRASAQETVKDVLSFLLTNRSIPTDDFLRDEHAAMATRDAITGFLLVELATLPIGSSAGGFTYRLDRGLGTVVLSSDSFGPFFTERSLTAGTGQASFGLTYQRARFEKIDGRSLRDGTIVATASKLRDDPVPFDVETLSLTLATDTVTFSGNYGITDRFDVSAAVPFVSLELNGERIDNYRGRVFPQATASASASGVGDVVLRAKYNAIRQGGSGVAFGGEFRLPTGNADNLLGAGETSVQPRVMASLEGGRVAVHGNLGYTFRDSTDELDYAGGLTVVAVPRLTVVGEISGRRLESFGRLTDVVAPHPSLTGIDTIRLTGVQQASNRAVAVLGFKWNVVGTWLLSANCTEAAHVGWPQRELGSIADV